MQTCGPSLSLISKQAIIKAIWVVKKIYVMSKKKLASVVILIALLFVTACGKDNKLNLSAFNKKPELSLDELKDPDAYSKKITDNLSKYDCAKLQKELKYTNELNKKATNYVVTHKGQPNKKYQKAFDIGVITINLDKKLTKEYNSRCI